MYRQKDHAQLEFEDFYHPFGSGLRSDNRWVRLAKIIPWEHLEAEYARLFSEKMGAPAKPFRMALGALIIKERLDITDEETVEQIRENHYLQYFIGITEYKDEVPFDPSMMVHFRKRLSREIVSKINADIVMRACGNSNDSDPDAPTLTGGNEANKQDMLPDKDESPNSGTLIIDASVVPADITYPTDIDLLNAAREKLEEIIDVLHEGHEKETAKPRTYRNNARRDYLRVIRKRKKSPKVIRKGIKQQLQYIRRDLGHIETMVERHSGLSRLSRRQYRDLLICAEVYRQQMEMFHNKTRSIGDRIVSISQPHVRPIVRGKKSADVEFGAKITVSRFDGYDLLEYVSWNNYNESTLLKDHVEAYHQRFGIYPKAVMVDKLYRNRENIRFCTENGIRISGPRLGRPPKDHVANRKIEREDEGIRNQIEGTFGRAKRKYGLDRLTTKLAITSESTIAMIILVMNLEKYLKYIFARLLNYYLSSYYWLFA
jgi:hypothetical protein